MGISTQTTLPRIPENFYKPLSAVGLNETEAKILLYVAYVMPYATQEELAEHLNMSRSLVSTALSKMTSMGIILSRRRGRVREYYVKNVRSVVRRLFQEVERTLLPLGKEIIAQAKKLPRNKDPERRKKIEEMDCEREELIEFFNHIFEMLGE